MTKKTNKGNNKEDPFEAKTVDEKLNLLYKVIQSEVETNRTRHEELRSDLKKVSKRVSNLENRMAQAEKHNDGIEDDLLAAQNSIHALEQAALCTDIIIKGIPEVEGTSTELREIIVAILHKLNCDSLVHDIAATIRLGKPVTNTSSTSNRSRVVLLQMKSPHCKQQLMVAKKKTEIKGSDIAFKNLLLGDDRKQIFFDERLTKYMGDLYYKARQLKHDGACHSVWVHNGLLFVRLTETSNAKRIINIQQLNDLKQPAGRPEKRPRAAALSTSDASASAESSDEQNSETETERDPIKQKNNKTREGDQPRGRKKRKQK